MVSIHMVVVWIAKPLVSEMSPLYHVWNSSVTMGLVIEIHVDIVWETTVVRNKNPGPEGMAHWLRALVENSVLVPATTYMVPDHHL